MKKILKPRKIKLTQAEAEILLRVYENDIEITFEDGYVSECWIGTKGTTVLQLLLVSYDEEFDSELVCFGKTVSEMRKDPKFIYALLNDGDVNHGIDRNGELREEIYKDTIEFLMGRKNIPPITACGGINFFDAYIDK